jgi:MFS family permease
MDTFANDSQGTNSEKTIALALLFLVGAVNYLDRSSLSIAHGPIRGELHLSETQMGALLSVFSLAYGFVQLPIGPVLDKFGPRRVLGIGITLWSFAQVMVGTVSSLGFFISLRLLLGCGEAPFYPASIKLISDHAPLMQRGRSMAVVNASAMIGQAIAPPLLTLLMLRLGWRWMFIVSGTLGLLLAIVWFSLLRERKLNSKEQREAAIAPLEWRGLFRSRLLWCLMAGFGGVNYAAWFYIAWLPAYLQNGRGISIVRSGWLAAIPFIAAAIGMSVSGWLADKQVSWGIAATKVHLRQIILGMSCSALSTIFVSRVAHAGAAVICVCSALFFLHFAGNSGWGYVQASSPRHLVATVGSIQNFGSQIIGGSAPFITGWTLNYTHHFGSAFALCAAATICGALSYLPLVRYEGFTCNGSTKLIEM